MRAFKGNLSLYAPDPTDPRDMELEIRNVTLSFDGLTALHHVSFSMSQGDLLGLIGPNGAGKTSLMNCLTGLAHPQEGQIVLNSTELQNLSPSRIARLGISRTFQHSRLFPRDSVLTNILAARHIHSHYLLRQALFFTRAVKQEEAYHLKIAEELIDFLGLQAHRETAVQELPFPLRKRVEIGRALALQPRLLILDEPFSGLSLEETEFISQVILDLNGLWNQSILVAEHDPGSVMEIASRIVALDFGTKIAEGSPDFIQNHPQVLKAYSGYFESHSL